MATIQIRKKAENVWKHITSIPSEYMLSKFYFKLDNGVFFIVEDGGSRREMYNLSEITVYDDTAGGVPETFTTDAELYARLLDLKYTGFDSSIIYPPTPITDLVDYKADFVYDGVQTFSIPLNVVLVSVHQNLITLDVNQYSRAGSILTIVPILETDDIINVRGITTT